jgi:predicted CoA-substrate-specific enzyme activase
MNDKCAAGTGRFLEYTSSRLRVAVEQIGELALSRTEEAIISSTCTVFAESEVVSLIAQGVAVPAILRGLHRSLARRIVSMIRMVGLDPPFMLSGGVVLNQAMRRMLEEETGETAVLPSCPQLVGAKGAALFALDIGSGKIPGRAVRRGGTHE